MPEERLSPDRAVRLLRAKAGELEARVLADFNKGQDAVTYAGQAELRMFELTADLALVASLLADHIEHCSR